MLRKWLTPLDELFLYMESRETMMHVAGLMPFSPPEGAPPDRLRRLVEELRESSTVQSPWNLKLRTPDFLLNPLQSWVEDTQFDVDYHIRRSALPSPGDERELGVLVSRLHGNPIDFHRPPWEVHIIEGLERGRFALYVKVHHSLVDGFTAMRILNRSLSTEASDFEKPMFFALPPPDRGPSVLGDDPLGLVRETLGHTLQSAKEVGRALVELGVARRDGGSLMAPLMAPSCVLNRRIGRNRRFATQQYSLDRLKELAKLSGGTLNDVVVALCAGSLRRFLLERGELPERPLVAFLPVNARAQDDPGGGNSVGAILVSMATDVEDPRERIAAIIDSTQRAKAQLSGLSPGAILAYSALLMSPFGLQVMSALTGLRGSLPITFNVCISNVRGPDVPLYLRGARLEATYPVSLPVHGMALNITCMSYAGTLNFGFVGCRDTLPHLQKLAVYTGEALQDLERAFAPKRKRTRSARPTEPDVTG